MSDGDATCPNCGARGEALTQAAYCPACGQARHLHPPTLMEFGHEFVTHYVALEGALWRTLAMLVRRPGELTRQWLGGRRSHWLNPLRLYLSLSFLFFVTSALLPGQTMVNVNKRPEQAAAASAPRAASDAAPAAADAWIETRLDAMLADEMGRERFQHRFKASMPYVVFALVPLFAGWVTLVQWRRRIPYGAHVVFALHVHAFTLLIAWLATLVGVISGLGWLLWLLANPWYMALAMRRVYGNAPAGAAWRTALVLALHTTTAVAATSALALAMLVL